MKKYRTMKRPDFLKKGDTVAVIAIASAPSDAQLASNWKEQLESWGLKVKIGENITAKFPGDFAGTHQQRADDLAAMVADKEVKAIISIRGGYGTMHTIKNLDLEDNKNLFVVASILISGIGGLTIKIPYAISGAGEITNVIQITSIATALIVGIIDIIFLLLIYLN